MSQLTRKPVLDQLTCGCRDDDGKQRNACQTVEDEPGPGHQRLLSGLPGTRHAAGVRGVTEGVTETSEAGTWV